MSELNHKAMYPEQYSHALVGKKMRTQDGKVSGIVERVFNTRFGELATFKEQDQAKAYAINTLVMAENTIILGKDYVSIIGKEENDILIAVQYDGTAENGKDNRRLCIVLDCDGDLSVYEPTPEGLAMALKQLAIADRESLDAPE